VDDPQVASPVLDRDNLQGDIVLIIAQEDEAALPGSVHGRRLIEDQAAVVDDVENLVISDSMSSG
jgi:hypothetical protein